MEPEYVIVVWFFLAIGVGVLAHLWNRSGAGWFVFSLVFTPVIGLIGLVLTRKRPGSQ